jgi:hypothetical protein
MAAPSLCGGALNSRRGLLASLWSIVVCLTFIAFIVALIFTMSAKNSDSYYSDYYDDAQQREGEGGGEQQQQEMSAEMAVTSRAMAFCALWTAVLATLMAIFGAVILGWQSPTGIYYTCCSPQVHRTTPLALGSFVGALLMFANLTLVCSVLFGEFDVSTLFVGRCLALQFVAGSTQDSYAFATSTMGNDRFEITAKEEMIKKRERILQCVDLPWHFLSCVCS